MITRLSYCCAASARCALALLLAIGLGSRGAAQTTPAVEPDDAAAIAWLRTAAQPFIDSTLDRDAADALLQALGDARVYGIGEATHGDHQDQSFKVSAIKALVMAGRIDTLALECNRLAASGFDAYAQGGTGDLVALIRDRSFFRTWQNDEFAGLILWLRAWNATAAHPVRVIGVDNQDANRDIRVALDFIRARDPGLYATLSVPLKPMLTTQAQGMKFYKWVVATPKPAYDAATRGVLAVGAVLETQRRAWSRLPGYDDAAYSARVAYQGLHQFDLEAGNPDVDLSGQSAEYNNRRDVAMAANLVAFTEGHRAALWAHDMHVLGGLDPGIVAQGYVTMGSELRRSLGTAYVSVGFAWSEGSFNAVTTAMATSGALTSLPDWVPQAAPNQRADDLGRVLAEVGPPRFWVDLRRVPPDQPWSTRPMYRGWSGATFNAKQWQADPSDRIGLVPSHDVLVYFHTITPSGMWPRLPAAADARPPSVAH